MGINYALIYLCYVQIVDVMPWERNSNKKRLGRPSTCNEENKSQRRASKIWTCCRSILIRGRSHPWSKGKEYLNARWCFSDNEIKIRFYNIGLKIKLGSQQQEITLICLRLVDIEFPLIKALFSQTILPLSQKSNLL